MRRNGSTREVSQADGEEDLEEAFDVLRQSVARADAMVCATEHQLERFTWGVENDSDDSADDDAGRRLDQLAHLLGATKEAVRAAMFAGGQVAAKLAHRRKCP